MGCQFATRFADSDDAPGPCLRACAAMSGVRAGVRFGSLSSALLFGALQVGRAKARVSGVARTVQVIEQLDYYLEAGAPPRVTPVAPFLRFARAGARVRLLGWWP